jgi:hypothetical protein
MADGVLLRPLPTGHSDHSAHGWLPGVDFQCPSGQLEHSRLEDRVADVVSYRPGAQTVRSLHSRSDEPVGPLEVYWFTSHESLCVWQMRLEVNVGSTASNSPSVHVVTSSQGSPLSAFE